VKLWDDHGTPLRPHLFCPKCGDHTELGSHFDEAWCHACGWKGSLTEMWEAAKCAHCDNDATCFGEYETCNDQPAFACDTCCLHGCEDGWCEPVVRDQPD
jgi:hypothetical protein